MNIPKNVSRSLKLYSVCLLPRQEMVCLRVEWIAYSIVEDIIEIGEGAERLGGRMGGGLTDLFVDHGCRSR